MGASNMRVWLAALAIGFAAPATAASLQDQYNVAQTAFDAGKMEAARTGFAAILPRLDANPKSAATAAVVRARLGAATLALGEQEAAIVLLTRGAAGLVAGSEQWQQTMLDLAHADEIVIDYDGAATVYRKLLAAPSLVPAIRLSATVGMVRVLTFSDPVAARTYADQAIEQGKAIAPGKRTDILAQLQTLRGRIDLNDGNPREARKWFEKAFASAGGLTTMMNVSDVRVRGDLALAAYLSGDAESARKYLAYTGAGQLPEQGFELGADMPLPACAPAGPVLRDDMAVVEFSLAPDGRVGNVMPIYVSRRGGSELAFARAVRTWSWRPAAAKALPPFWRQAVRMELRCANQGPGDGSLWGLGADVTGWLAEHAPEPLPEALRGEAAALPVLRTELARRTSVFGARSPQLLPVLIAIGGNDVVENEESISADIAGIEIATANAAPRDLVLYFRMGQAIHTTHKRTRAEVLPALEALQKAFDAEGNGQTRGAALVANYIAYYAGIGQDAKVTEAYRRILAMPLTVVPNGDPLRQTARLQIASVEAAASRIDAARELLAQTGLTADQCSAFPITPVQTGRARGLDFPKEALQWSFEGTVRVAYDLDVTGKPVNVRTVTASPPLVFDAATEAAARTLRYKPIFRDGATIGCADLQQAVRYQINRN